jgi:vacuolar-type H+-ATPase subunit C/Vma6
MASPLRRYAYAQARIRARIAGLASRRQLEILASYPDETSLRAELAAKGHAVDEASMLRAFAWVLDLLSGPPAEVVRRYRDRYAAENLKLLLRARERGLAFTEVEPLLLPLPEPGRARLARELLEAPSLADALARLPAQPFGEALRQHARAAGAREVERFRLEAVAEREVYERLWNAVLALPPADRRAAVRLLGTKLDCVSLARFARLRAYHGLGAEELLVYAIRGGRALGAAERAALAHEPPERWAGALARTPYARALAEAPSPPALEHALAQLLAREARAALRGSPFQIGVPLGYLVLVETECADVRALLAGKRFAWDAARIAEGLASDLAAPAVAR